MSTHADIPTQDIQDWIDHDPDPETAAQLRAADPDTLAEWFAAPLQFGTAGLRGPVRGGPSGMNVAVVTAATWAVGEYVRRNGISGPIVVGADARHGSAKFYAAATEVLAAQGHDVIALPQPSPTPLVAFAATDCHAAAAIQITASHNPPADNGYKVYLGGAQIVPPADSEIEELIAAAPPADQIARQPISADQRADANTERYLARLAQRFAGNSPGPLRIALTAMHGVGGEVAREALRQAGFSDVHVVQQQFSPDPDFPTVAFPNPEEPGAADLLLDLARTVDADLAIALDPDADRCAVGVAIDGTWRMLTGDETGAILGYMILAQSADPATAIVANTIVSSSMLRRIAESAGATYARTLTGFKWLMRAGDDTPDRSMAYAYEEAIGHCVDPQAVRDKDGISAAVALSRIAAQTPLPTLLSRLNETFGVHRTSQRSVRVDDLAEITQIMDELRTTPPTELGGVPVTMLDYLARTDALVTDAVEFSGAANGVSVRVIARPSGTEPKAKFYLQVALEPNAPDAETVADSVLSALDGDIRARLRLG